jgi:hypothetical protein
MEGKYIDDTCELISNYLAIIAVSDGFARINR